MPLFLEVIELLKDAGVESQPRSGGLTAAGHALNAYERGAMEIDELVGTLSVLVGMGENIDAPVWQEWRPAEHTTLSHQWSEETLLDAIYIRCGDGPLFQRSREHSRVPNGVLTVSGISIINDIDMSKRPNFVALSICETSWPTPQHRKAHEFTASSSRLSCTVVFQ